MASRHCGFFVFRRFQFAIDLAFFRQNSCPWIFDAFMAFDYFVAFIMKKPNTLKILRAFRPCPTPGFLMLLLVLTWCLGPYLYAQQTRSPNFESRGKTSFRCMFYNVENLFDTVDDPQIDDSEFLPQSERHWNTPRYLEKINHIAKVVIAVGGWEPPAVVGLAEVENKRVLDDLTKEAHRWPNSTIKSCTRNRPTHGALT